MLNSRINALSSLTSSTFTRLFSLPARITAGRFVASIQNAQPNISAHYDLGNDIFEGQLRAYIHYFLGCQADRDATCLAFLSRDMTYSCAIFPSLDADLKLGEQGQQVQEDVRTTGLDDTQLYEGQQRKLRHIIAKAGIKPGHKVSTTTPCLLSY